MVLHCLFATPHLALDVYLLDLSTMTWTKPVCAGTPPSPRYGHTMNLIGDKILIIGGSDGSFANISSVYLSVSLPLLVCLTVPLRLHDTERYFLSGSHYAVLVMPRAYFDSGALGPHCLACRRTNLHPWYEQRQKRTHAHALTKCA